MKKTIIFIAMAVLCLFFRGNCQQGSKYALNKLSIGDKVPDLVFDQVLNGERLPVALSAFKGKAVILDFWGTWCGSCISSFPKMEKLQSKFGRNLKILFVNDSKADSLAQIVAFLDRRVKEGQGLKIPVVYERDFISAMFPHRAYPHYVWIGADRRVAAVTGSTEVNEVNLARFFAGLDLNLKVKGI
jgi:thiol-disulfide isomerase/thioredoxin